MISESFHQAPQDEEAVQNIDSSSDTPPVSKKKTGSEKDEKMDTTAEKNSTARLAEKLHQFHCSDKEGKEDVEDASSKMKHELAGLSREALILRVQEEMDNAQQAFERSLRIQADSENMLNRAQRNIASAHKFALEQFINALLPIVDSLELCIQSVADTEIQEMGTAQAVVDGVKLTLKMFLTTLEKFHVRQINPKSELFNPEYHQATSTKLDNSVEQGTVLSVLQKGYTLAERLLRPALVIVSRQEESVEK